MASFNEKNGKVHVRIFRKGEAPVCKSFLLKRDAQAWARQTESDIQSGRYQSNSVVKALTLAEGLTRYASEVSPSKKGGIQEAYLVRRIAREDHKALALPMPEVSGQAIASLRDQWTGQGLAPASVRQRLAMVSHCFEIAIKEWSIPCINPVRLIRKPKVDNARSRRFAEGELDAVLFATDSHELAPAVKIALASAMRLSEIAGLHWKDVDQVGRVIFLRDTKNGASRSVPLSPDALAVLSAMPRRIDGRLFSVTSGSLSQAWTRAVSRARKVYVDECKASGAMVSPAYLVDLHFHDLRHEATSRLFERGDLNVVEVASVTGHKTLQMLSRYSHMSASRIAEKFAAKN